MSSLFSYELDEKQIRSTLQNSRAVEYTESNWDDFETNFIQACSNQNTNRFKLPEFNLNINRNVVLPVVFIAALVGVSAIMLSFVDFKTNTPSQVEKQLIPNPDNFSPEKTETAAIVKKEPVKTVTEKPIVKADSVPVKTEATPTVNTTQVVVNTNTIHTNQATNSSNTNTQSRVAKTDTGSVSNSIPPVITSSSPSHNGQKRKRRRKVPTEQIETIKAPSLLGQQDAASKEPELELKLN